MVFLKLRVLFFTLNALQFSIQEPFLFFALNIVLYKYFTSLGRFSDLLFVLLFSYDSKHFIGSGFKTGFFD